MKKSIGMAVALVLVIALGLSGGLSVFAAEGIPGDSVYASISEQDELFELIQNHSDFKSFLDQQGITVEKDSITSVYTLDLDEYANTEQFSLEPLCINSKGKPKKESGNVYAAKTQTTSNTFGGNLKFYVEDDYAFLLGFTPSAETYDNAVPNAFTMASCDYEDHAERIKDILGTEGLIPADSVRYVEIPYLGTAFYIQYEEFEVIVYLGYEGIASDTAVEVRGELLDEAKEYHLKQEAQRREYEEWKREHPGEEWSYTGGGGGAALSGRTEAPKEEKQYNYSGLWFIIAAALVVTLIAVLFHRIRARKTDPR